MVIAKVYKGCIVSMQDKICGVAAVTPCPANLYGGEELSKVGRVLILVHSVVFNQWWSIQSCMS